MAKIKQLNSLQEQADAPTSSKNSQSPKKSKTPKQSASPKKSPASKQPESSSRSNDVGKTSAGGSVPERASSKATADKRLSSSEADRNGAGGKAPAKSGAELKPEPDLKKGSQGKSSDQTAVRGKEKAPNASPVQPPVDKTAKSRTKKKGSDDCDDFESPKTKGKDGSSQKAKSESKPADVKTKSIASYFMAKPKT